MSTYGHHADHPDEPDVSQQIDDKVNPIWAEIRQLRAEIAALRRNLEVAQETIDRLEGV